MDVLRVQTVVQKAVMVVQVHVEVIAQEPVEITVTPHVQVAVTNPVHPVQVVVPTTV